MITGDFTPRRVEYSNISRHKLDTEGNLEQKKRWNKAPWSNASEVDQRTVVVNRLTLTVTVPVQVEDGGRKIFKPRKKEGDEW